MLGVFLLSGVEAGNEKIGLVAVLPNHALTWSCSLLHNLITVHWRRIKPSQPPSSQFWTVAGVPIGISTT
jgi:hypothetical protein